MKKTLLLPIFLFPVLSGCGNSSSGLDQHGFPTGTEYADPIDATYILTETVNMAFSFDSYQIHFKKDGNVELSYQLEGEEEKKVEASYFVTKNQFLAYYFGDFAHFESFASSDRREIPFMNEGFFMFSHNEAKTLLYHEDIVDWTPEKGGYDSTPYYYAWFELVE